MAGKVFINYRRDDEPGYVHALLGQLERTFAPGQLFIDVDHIPAGKEFAEFIESQVSQCEVLLIIIGPRWLEIVDAQGRRRLDDPADFVRLEIEAAIAANKRLLPVLMNNARMPNESELPETLRPLVRRQAVSITPHRFKADAQHLVRTVETELQDALAASFGKNTCIAVVHGIGETDPNVLINAVTTAMASVRPKLLIDQNLHIHSSHGLTYASGTIHARGVTIAACYWNDISRFGDRLFDLVRSILFGGLNAPYFGEVGVEANNAATRLFSQSIFWLLSLMIAVLALLCVPVAVISMLASSASLAAFYVFPTIEWLRAPFIIVVTLGAGAWIAYLGSTQALRVSGAKTLGFWLFVSIIAFIGMFGVALGAGQLTLIGADTKMTRLIGELIDSASPWLGLDSWTGRLATLDTIGIHLAFLSWLQQAFGLLLVSLAAVLPVLLVLTYVCSGARWTNGRSLLLACILVIGIWFALQFAIWPEHLLSSAALSLYSIGEARQSTARYLDLATVKLSPPTSESAAGGYYLLNWYDFLFFAFLLLTLVLVASVQGLRWLWSRWHTNVDLAKFKPQGNAIWPERTGGPRLIISSPIWLLALVFLAFVTSSAILAAFAPLEAALEGALEGKITLEELRSGIYVNSDYVRICVLVSIGIFATLARTARGPMQVLLDVINHFYAPHRGYPIRSQVSERLQRTLEFLLADDDKPHLVVLAHGQGTIASLEKLFGTFDHNGLWHRGLSERVSSLTLVTFGSPLSHIYQRYFPQAYPLLGSIPRFADLAGDRRVGWINCYRIDDYAGMHIENSIVGFPNNVPCEVGGHLSYWRAEVFARVFAQPGMDTVMAPITVTERTSAEG